MAADSWLTRNFVDIPALTSSLLSHPKPYKPFLPLLTQSSNPEEAIPLLTSSLLASLISSSLLASPKTKPDTERAISKLYTYLSGLARSADSGLQDIAVQEYSAILRTRRAREIFWNQREDTITPLIDILRAAAGVGRNGDESTLWSSGSSSSLRSVTEVSMGGGVGLQLLYHVLLVLWQLSFAGDLVGEGLEEYVAAATKHFRVPQLTRHSESTR